MQKFAELTCDARQAITQGNPDRLAALIDANFDLRRSICPLHAKHVEMVEAARSVGASAKYAGSGGAIVGTYADEDMYHRLVSRLESIAEIPCHVIKPMCA